MFVFVLWPIISLKNTPFHPLVTGTFYPKLSTCRLSKCSVASGLQNDVMTQWKLPLMKAQRVWKGGKGIPTETSKFGSGCFSLVGFQRVTSFYSHQCCCACVVCKWEFTDFPEQATSCRTSHFLSVADNKSNTRFCESLELQNWFLRDNYAFKEV